MLRVEIRDNEVGVDITKSRRGHTGLFDWDLKKLISFLQEMLLFTHRHVRRGSEYQLLDTVSLQIFGSVLADGDTLQIYQDKDGKKYARKVEEFNDGRFVEIKDEI